MSYSRRHKLVKILPLKVHFNNCFHNLQFITKIHKTTIIQINLVSLITHKVKNHLLHFNSKHYFQIINHLVSNVHHITWWVISHQILTKLLLFTLCNKSSICSCQLPNSHQRLHLCSLEQLTVLFLISVVHKLL